MSTIKEVIEIILPQNISGVKCLSGSRVYKCPNCKGKGCLDCENKGKVKADVLIQWVGVKSKKKK